jgi:hypothetical protein
MHIVLLGDSIFDNAVYVHASEPDVQKQVQALEGNQIAVFSLIFEF